MSTQSVNHPTPFSSISKSLAVTTALAVSLLISADAFSFNRSNRSGPSARVDRAVDPGVRGGPPAAGGPLPGLNSNEAAFFEAGLDAFTETDGVKEGLGPRFNADGCGTCHMQPAVGGSSPPVNPQVALANAQGAINQLPSFITVNGPVREVRYVRDAAGNPDGGVHQLFVITGRSDAPRECNIAQEDFETEMERHNIIFRIPTPTFGLGLIEGIADSDIMANLQANSTVKSNFGIRGHLNRFRTGRATDGTSAADGTTGIPNRSANDGTITRFGWKGQNKSSLIFAGEAYNVEQGVTNELFPTETDETPTCATNPTPEDQTEFDATVPTETSSDPVRFTHFMRLLAPPTPAPDDYLPGIPEGRELFTQIGCALCHTPSFTTRKNAVAALSEKPVNLYSDLAVHAMGPDMADSVSQGGAGGDEFRTAPLWGLGQRIFFLHDGRTTDLTEAIQAHRSDASAEYPASEANAVIDHYNQLSEQEKQQMLNFLRSL